MIGVSTTGVALWRVFYHTDRDPASGLSQNSTALSIFNVDWLTIIYKDGN